MKRFLAIALMAVVALGATSAVYANVCAFDAVPAATLLFPFVQLDYNNPVNGDTTLFSITNVSSAAVIAHVTLWADDSSAILDFNIVLSGYDVQTMNIRDILINGDLPNTGTVASSTLDWDLSQVVNPLDGDATPLGPAEDGPVSDNGLAYDTYQNLDPSVGTDSLVARCNPGSPSYPDYPLIPGSTLANFQDYLTTYQYFGGIGALGHFNCTIPAEGTLNPSDWWQERNLDQPTWMYITVDTVETCNKLFPTVAQYWQAGEVRDENFLIGDVMWVNTAARYSEADNAVHIEADPEILRTATIGVNALPVTFYDRYSTQTGAIQDHREPLPTAWAFRYMGAGTADIDTYIRLWKNRDDMVLGSSFYADANDCIAYTYYAWDEDENFITVEQAPWSLPGTTGVYIPNLFPLETQEVAVDQFNLPAANGWMVFIWPQSNTDAIDYNYQTWMGVKYGAFGQFSAAMSGAVMANYNCFADQVLPVLNTSYYPAAAQ